MTLIHATLGDITKDWLTACLRPAVPDGTVSAFRLEPMADGVGMMSAMSRVHLTWADDVEGPDCVVVKLAAGNETNRGVAQQFNLYLKEVRYYEDLSPRAPRISPTVYASAIDADQNFFLLMEDATGYRMGNQVEGATLEEAQICAF